MIGFMDAIQRPWEDYFTVVHWDQRQTGKSYCPASDEAGPLTVEQLVEDAEEVIRILCSRLNQEKVFLLGHSWGSVLGMHVVKRHPNWLHAYIGVSQIVNMMDGERELFNRLVSRATEQKEEQLIAKLATISPYPDPLSPEKSLVESSAFVRSELSRIAGEAGMRYLPYEELLKIWNFEKIISPHLTITDLIHALFEDDVALFRPPYSFTKEFMGIDLPSDVGSSFQVPIIFFTGSHDWQTPRILSDQWFSQIDAPYKELIHFEESCHMIVNEEPGKVLTALVNKVLPFEQEGAVNA